VTKQKQTLDRTGLGFWRLKILSSSEMRKKFYCIFDVTKKENFSKDELHLIPTTAFFKRRVLFYTKITLKTPLRIKKKFQ
jgi:hypothetical protein